MDTKGNIVKLINSKIVLKKLSQREQFVVKNVMNKCFAVRPNERVLVICDQKEFDEACLFFEGAKYYTKHVILAIIKELEHDAQEPTREIKNLIFRTDVCVLVTTKSLSHTKARQEACQKGVRIASLPGIDKEMILRALAVDYSRIKELTEKIAHLLTIAREARVRTNNGTDVSFSLKGRLGIADTGYLNEPGKFGNLPAGEAFTAPLEGKTNGVVIFDGCFADIDLDKPIKVVIKNGVVEKVYGGRAASKLKKILEVIGPSARNIAELGIGTNRKARLSTIGANTLEIEKVFGTVHVALGNNITIGGKVDVPFHSDGVILSPILEVDGKIVLKNRKFLL